jgi:hypothetical protein
MLEDVEDQKDFEAAITADYDAETTVEREFVLRLASLLWRIRRATSIETSLLHTRPSSYAIGDGCAVSHLIRFVSVCPGRN